MGLDNRVKVFMHKRTLWIVTFLFVTIVGVFAAENSSPIVERGNVNSELYTMGDVADGEDSVLCVAYTENSSYLQWCDTLASCLRIAGADLTYFRNPADGTVSSLLATETFDQIWVYDLDNTGTNWPLDFQAIADWYNARTVKNAIFDGRITGDLWNFHGRPIVENYYVNLRDFGGGACFLTDHNVYSNHGMNDLMGYLNFNPFIGNFTTTCPFDETNQLMNYPNIIDFLYNDSSTGECPVGLQPNGQILYACAWHSGNPDTPAISSTFEGTIGFHVHIVHPADGLTFCSTDTIHLIAEPDGGRAPFTYEWVSDIDGVLGYGDTLNVTLSPGEHNIQVNSFDTEDRYDEDEITVLVEVCGVDSVWFWEETECDEQNIVHICYTLSGHTSDISGQMSADSGATWVEVGTEWFTTLLDTTGDLGEDIVPTSPDSHCFDWVMSEDMPDSEGYNWMVEISEFVLLDTFFILDSMDIGSRPDYGRGLGFNEGYYWIYDYNREYVYRTPCIDCSPTDSFHIGRHNCDIDFADGWIYYAGGDPIVVRRLDTTTGVVENIATMPYHGSGVQGVIVVGDNLLMGLYDDDSNNMYILSVDLLAPLPASSWDTLITAPLDSCHAMEGLAFAYGYLWGSNNWGRIVQIDLRTLEYIGCYPVPNIGSGAEGLCWDGSYLWYHNNATQKLYKIIINDTTVDRKVAIGPLDSRPPSLDLTCSPDTLFGGDTLLAHWNITDLFYINQPGSLYLSACEMETTFAITDTIFMQTVPAIDCSSCTLIVAARDSFCNWGYDTCQFVIRSPVELLFNLEADSLGCLPDGSFTPYPLQVRAIVSNVGGGVADSLLVTLHFPGCFSVDRGENPVMLYHLEPGGTDTLIFELDIDEGCRDSTECIWGEVEGFE